MACISIDGTSGVGKSLLAAQLSALTRFPVIMEGERGAVPEWVLRSLSDPTQTKQRTAWFTERCRIACERAQDIGHGQQHCFLDSGPLTHEAYLRFDAEETKLDFGAYAKTLRHAQPDLSVVLVAEAETLEQHIIRRGRSEEITKVESFRRVWETQRHCLLLRPAYRSLFIPRTTEDFCASSDLERIWLRIQEALG